MPLKKYVPPRPNFTPLRGKRTLSAQFQPSSGPVLVPITTTTPPPPTGGGFSSAFSNAFDI